MRIKDQGVIINPPEGSDYQSCAFASVCALDDGRWVCCFRAAPVKSQEVGQRPMITWSDDQGAHWSEPIAPFVSPDLKGRRGIFRSGGVTAMGGRRVLATLAWVDHTDPSLPLFNEQTQGLLDMQLYTTWSEDGGETWSQPRHIDVSPFTVPVAITGPTLLLSDGRLACQFEIYKHYYDTTKLVHAPVLMFSGDGGQTWPEAVYPAKDPENRIFYWDQRPSVIGPNRLFDVFWTFDNATGDYRTMHAARSEDNGRTWSAVWDTGVPGQAAPVAALSDGRLVLPYVDRTDEPTIQWRVSADGGRTWPTETEGIVYRASMLQSGRRGTLEKAWSEMLKYSVGLPTTAKLPNNEVLVVYYAGPKTDHTAVRWARLGD
jgi:hypothetical protein